MPKETPEERSTRLKAFWARKREEKQKDLDKALSVKPDDHVPVGTPPENIIYTPDIQAEQEYGIYKEGIDIVSNLTNDTLASVTVTKQEPTETNYMSALPGMEEFDQEITVQEYKITTPILERVRGRVSIKPYVSGEENMGLENPNQPGGAMAICPGLHQTDHIGCNVVNNVATYFTGLNEFDSEVQLLSKDKKLAKIKEIRTTVAYLENTLNANFEVTPETCMANYGSRDKHNPDSFWGNVTKFKSVVPGDSKGNPTLTYWDEVELKLDNDGCQLDLKKPEDIVKFYAIEARGLSMVAPSLQVAIDEPGYKFYMDSPYETSNIRTAPKKLKGKALGNLSTIYDNDENKLFFMAVALAPVRASDYKRGGFGHTPKDVLYNDLYDYIEGRTAEFDTNVTIPKFLEAYNMPIDELTIRAVIKTATTTRLIDLKGSTGMLYYRRDNADLGINIEEMVAYLRNPLHEATWKSIRKDVEHEWTT